MVKIAGKQVEKTLFEDFIVLPQVDEDIIIKARAVPSYEEFEALCPLPKPPVKHTRNGTVQNTDDETFKLRVEQFALQKLGWLAMKSLYEIEFETLEPENPKTWPRWEKELQDSGFTTNETSHILGLVLDVNNLNEAKMKEARDSFLHGQEQEQSDSCGPEDGPTSTPSGEPAQD